MSENGRHDPWDVSLEQSALGACIVDQKHLDALAAGVSPETFYDPYHQRIYARMLQMQTSGAVTVQTLAASLKSDPAWDETGGARYLDALWVVCPLFPPVADYVRLLKDLADRRALAAIGQTLVEDTYLSPSEAPTQALTDGATSALLSLGVNSSRPSTSPAKVAVRVLDGARAALAGERPPAIPTGLKKLDRAMGGMQAEDMVFIAARSGMGKTSLWVNLALNAAQAGHPVLLFSKEMPDFQLTQWMLCNIDYSLRDPKSEMPIHHWKFRLGCLSNFEIQRLDRARVILEGMRLEICDDKSLTASGMMSRSRAFARRYPGELGLIGLDFLQNLEDDERGKNDSREQIVSRLAYGQKRLAGMLGWPVLTTVQLKNKGDGRTAKDAIPTAEDIRESGAVEMSADLVICPHRKAFFHKQQEPTVPHDRDEWITWRDKMLEIENDLWLRGFKNRHGDPSALNLELFCEMGSSAIRDERPGRYHLPSDQAEFNGEPLF